MSELLPDPAEVGQGTGRVPGAEDAEADQSPHPCCVSMTAD